MASSMAVVFGLEKEEVRAGGIGVALVLFLNGVDEWRFSVSSI